MSSPLDWTHVDMNDSERVAWVRSGSGIDPLIAEALLEEDTRPRTRATDKGVLVILRGVNLNPGSVAEDMVSVRVWIEPNRVVTTTRRPLKSVRSLQTDLENGEGPQSPAEFIEQLASRIGDFISEAIEHIEVLLEEAEESGSVHAGHARSTPFTALRRQTARIRRYLAPQREALERLSQATDSLLGSTTRDRLREEVNRLTLLLEDLDLVRERAIVAQEDYLGALAYEQNARMLVLSIIAAVFLPLSFLTGLMGMNVAGLPGTENNAAFLILVVIMLLAAGLIMLLFRWRRWI